MVVVAEHKLSKLVVGGLGESFSTRIYAEPAVFRDGAEACGWPWVLARLKRLGYAEAASAPPATGQYVLHGGRLVIGVRGFQEPFLSQDLGIYELSRTWISNRWSIRDSSGNAAPFLALEPEVVEEISGAKKVRREPAAFEEIPRQLRQAVLAAEDRRFYAHGAIDWRAVGRALWVDLRRRRILLGASTITQQLAKNFFLNPRRTLSRKIEEAALAIYLEHRYGKDRLLTLYLNHIYLGQSGSLSIAGVKSAAKFYFGKKLPALTLPDCALLAALIRSPYYYNPFERPREALWRRDWVLNRMRIDGAISLAQLQNALRAPLAVNPRPPLPARKRFAAYYVAEILRQIVPRYGDDAVFRGGLKVYTAMDPVLQEDAYRALARPSRIEAALAALDPETGRVKALVGGRDFAKSQFNRATQALRQPGSAFKPILYAAALEKGLSPSTVLDDRPRSYHEALGDWNPRNYNERYWGPVSLRQALAHSLNAAALDAADKVGIAAVIDMAGRLGLTQPIQRNLTSMLGSSETTLLEISAAYAPFANGGFRVKPLLVLAVLDAEGRLLETDRVERESAIKPEIAFVLTSLLEGVVREGTARSLAALGFRLPAAGKTGTTNLGRDAWFVGYTPRLLCGVWAGDDRRRATGLTGAKDALPLWEAFMSQALMGCPAKDFTKPAGVVEVAIDPASGLRARSGCPVRIKEFYVSGTEPTAYCNLHEGGVMGWFKRIFKR